MYRKKICLVLCTTLCLIMLINACTIENKYDDIEKQIEQLGDVQGLELPIDRKGTQITMLVNSNISNLEDKFYVQKLSELTGLNIKVIPVSLANSKKKLQSMIASKQMPDISQNFLSKMELDEIAANDVLVSVNRYLNEMPNLKRLYADHPQNKRVFREYSSSDGQLYMIPTYGIKRSVNHCFMYRKDVFDRLGIPAWQDTEGFIEALQSLKEAYPDSYPFTSKLQLRLIRILAGQWGMETAKWGIDNSLSRVYDSYNHRWQYAGTSDNMKQMLLFLRELYERELLDPEFLTNTQANWEEKMLEGESSFVTLDWVDRMDRFTEKASDKIPGYDLQPGYPIGSAKKYETMDIFGSQGLIIANNSKAELSVKLADFLLSEAGAKLSTLGMPEKTYRYRDNKIEYLGFSKDRKLTINDLEEKYGLFTAGLVLRYDPECVYFQYTPRTGLMQNMAKNEELVQSVCPQFNIQNLEDGKKYDELCNLLQNEFDQFIGDYIFGNVDREEGWQAWLDKADKLGVKELETLIRKYSSESSN